MSTDMTERRAPLADTAAFLLRRIVFAAYAVSLLLIALAASVLGQATRAAAIAPVAAVSGLSRALRALRRITVAVLRSAVAAVVLVLLILPRMLRPVARRVGAALRPAAAGIARGLSYVPLVGRVVRAVSNRPRRRARASTRTPDPARPADEPSPTTNPEPTTNLEPTAPPATDDQHQAPRRSQNPGPVGRLRTRIAAFFDHALPAINARALVALRAAAETERRDIGRYHGTPIHAVYRTTVHGDTPPSPMELLRDPATWRDLVYWVVAAPLTVITTTVVATAWFALPLLVSVLLLAQFNIPAGPPNGPGPADWWTSLDTGDQVLLFAVMIVTALLAPAVTRAAATAHTALGLALLGPDEQARLQAELAEQRLRRRLTVEATEAERRRIERDLHDGAQQRLVALAMNLGMARHKFSTDPAGAERLVAEAHAEAKLALSELRTLARGIHPAVLTDRGLDAALSALAERVGVPVEVDVALSGRLPTPIESVAYFVVAEALTNVTRHARATSVTVSVTEHDDHVVVTIGDDGIGGADPARGTGLAGLAGRVDSVGGRFDVDSPPGGPTTIRAELPCES